MRKFLVQIFALTKVHIFIQCPIFACVFCLCFTFWAFLMEPCFKYF